ncbi:hypothetical protein PBI_SCTP2_128 [Salicola phage SCTP-2]|nr:hypothetical protein PBI_SCTP2_128 [Salicola phage SCTP-2]
MSMPAAQIGSITTGHGCWPPTIISQGATTVIGDVLPLSRIGDMAIPHVCVSFPFPAHGLIIATGSTTVIIESMPAARIGDFMSCSDIIATGAPTIIIGG